ncbi:hypothetical protein EV368DRAFT_65025 [Lentinula lateritia]|uniref:Uncharacterized protein n=1 Tax=Lentinula aff. lateritia TaxID=2804960 RepID=A0ACC1U9G5_9AGAR|nr:hypothetical protein F5876DRAFT_62997 [Lentinula aff. lateritia]KAJ3852320.1 hypothetical protein EV368DRAFT_65025 [Lentinula lateritia]
MHNWFKLLVQNSTDIHPTQTSWGVIYTYRHAQKWNGLEIYTTIIAGLPIETISQTLQVPFSVNIMELIFSQSGGIQQTLKMPPARHSPVGSASRQFYGDGYPNGVTSSTAYISDISGSPFRNEHHTGLEQSNPMLQAPVYPSSNLAKNPVAQNPGGTFHTFSVALRKEYSPIRTSPLVIKPRMAEISPQPRICSACGITHTVLWRKSKVHPGNYLCNRCGLWERNNRVERTTLAEGRPSMVKEFIVQSPYSSEGDILE